MIKNYNIDGSSISAELHGYLYNACLGKDGVYEYGNKLGYELVSNNLINLKDGLINNHGRFMRVLGTEPVKIENGISGVNRIDLIVVHFETDGLTETQDIRVIKGLPNGEAPKPTQQDIYESGKIYEMPLYKVNITGINVTSVVKQFDLIKNNSQIEALLNKQSSSGTVFEEKVKSVYKTVTIQPAEWVGNCYTYRDSLITATSNQEFGDPEYTGSSDDAMFKALAKARIVVSPQTVGETKLYCLGKVPTIPVKFIVVFKGVK